MKKSQDKGSVKKSAPKKKMVRKKVRHVGVILSEDDYHYNEEKRKSDIKNEILDFLQFRNDFIVLDQTDDYFVVAKFSYLAIQNTYNSQGFQPLERVIDKKECLVRIIEFGDEPERNTLAYVLKRGGCPVVTINTKFDVEGKLDK